LKRGNDVIQSGNVDISEVPEGTVTFVGKTVFQTPKTAKPEKYSLVARLAGTKTGNSWDFWVFPQQDENRFLGKNIAVAESLLSQLLQRYPEAVSIDSDAGKERKLLLTDDLFSEESLATLDAGKSVLLLQLNGPAPGVTLGWWGMDDQRGTMLKNHPAFGGFPVRLDFHFRVRHVRVRICKTASRMGGCGHARSGRISSDTTRRLSGDSLARHSFDAPGTAPLLFVRQSGACSGMFRCAI